MVRDIRDYLAVRWRVMASRSVKERYGYHLPLHMYISCVSRQILAQVGIHLGTIPVVFCCRKGDSMVQNRDTSI